MNRTIALLFLGMVLALWTVPVSAFFDISVDPPVGTLGNRRLLSKGKGHAYGDGPHGPNECHGSDCRNDDCEGDECRGGSDPQRDEKDKGKGDKEDKGRGDEEDKGRGDEKNKGKGNKEDRGKGKNTRGKGSRDRRRFI